MTRTSLLAIGTTVAIVLASAAIATPASAQPRLPGGPNNPNTPTYPQGETYDCSDQLGYLRRVYTSELAAVDDHTQVWVTPVCLNDDSVFRSEGNAGALRGTIAENEAMLTALFAANYRPEDVVGVRMMGEAEVTLLVHPFHK